jgi:drug/metabolite transporter (DMT)-like permease
LTGAAWAAFSGLGFGIFQTLNRRTVLGLDVYVSTFVQLALAGVVLVAASLATGDVAQLGGGSAAGIAWFAGAGVVHFFGGWTFLSLSQSRIGAARTSPLISTAPVFGVFIAAATLHEWPTAGAVGGIAVVLLGVYLVALERLADSARPPVADAIFGICTALCWSASPVMIKHGLRGVPSPLLGVTIGMICALAVYGAALVVTGRRLRLAARGRAMALQLLAGLFVGLSVWSRWTALDSASVGVVLALSLLAVPVVVGLSPIVVGRHLERITPRILLGSALVVVGALALVVES